MMQLEDQSPDHLGRVVLIGDTTVMTDVFRAGDVLAVRRLEEAHDRYDDYPNAARGDALLAAAGTPPSGS